LCRVVLAFVCLGTLVIARGGRYVLIDQLRTQWRSIVVLGVVNFASSQILALSALSFLPASINGVLNNTHPLWVAVGTAVFYPPQRPALLVAGSGVALIGVALVFLPDLLSSGGVPTLSTIGVGLSLAGSGVIALGTVVGRRVMQRGDPIAVTSLASGVAILPMAVLTLATGGFGPIFDAPANIKLLLVYLGIGCTAINFALWYYGLKYLAAAAASAFQYLIPPLGVALAVVFLHESLGAGLVLGTFCVLIGLIATQSAVRVGD
jgi:drug/metabolite transporter (DMT)-like permease